MSKAFRILRFTPDSRDFYVIGAKHTWDPSNPLIRRIHELLDAFAQRHPDGVVISENDCSVAHGTTLEESITRVAEAGAVHWYAHKLGLTVTCPEPPYADVISRLCEKFPPEDVAYTMIRVALGPQAASDIALEALDRQLAYWARPEMQKASGLRLTREWFTRHQVGDPFSDAVLAEMVKIRDSAVFAAVKRLWGEGRSLFMVYGMTHTEHLEQEFHDLVGVNPEELE
ncbi:MAG TPA: hypothetical protein VMJ72_00830 [Candidatus Paceibacterota bacterium]|nr:hypothetical protein [Candidatus Paceibacterota bacterium]